MIRLFTFFIMLASTSSSLLGQTNLGSRLAAMANTGVAVPDTWSTAANPAGITSTKTSTVAINYTKYLLDSELSKQSISFITPLKNNYLGLNFQRYGIAEYQEIGAGLVVAKKFGESLSIAIKGNYHQINITNYGATTGFSIAVGALYTYNEELSIGFYINNPSLQKYTIKSIQQNIITDLHLGTAYNVSNKLLIAFALIKDLKAPIDASVGVDYKLSELISLRGGLSAKPFKQYAGFGLSYHKLAIDIAVEKQSYIGYIPQISLAYAF